MRATENKTQWFKIGAVKHLSFIAKDVICYAVGCHAHFIELPSGKELSFTANFHSGNGDGIATMTGHRSIYVFAYAENCKSPICYIKTYPSFEVIAKITNGPQEGYLGMAFSETSLLIILGDKPTFSIFVWNWRSQEKFAEIKSQITIEKQIFMCNWGKPINMVQLGVDTYKISYWDIFTCCKRSFLANHVVNVPRSRNFAPFTGVLWTTEGGLFIVDRKGCIYTVDNEFLLDQVVEVSYEGKFSPAIAWYKGGLAVSGPDYNIRHYKKSGTWTCDWTMPLEDGVIFLASNKSEFLVGINAEGDIMKISNTDGITILNPDDSYIQDICMVYPVGEYIVALRNKRILNVFCVETGKSMTKFNLQRDALSVTANPNFPYLAVGYSDGNIDLVSVYNHEKLSVMTSFHLCSNPMQRLRFFEEGRILVATFLYEGDFFIIEGLPGTQMKVIAHISANCQVVDYFMVASQNCYRLFLLPVTTKCLAGNKIIRYCIVDKDTVNVKEYHFESKSALYYRLVPIRGPNRDRIFYALPYTSRNIHVMETNRGEDLARVTSTIKTGHQLRHFDMRITEDHALTWSHDGFVIARCFNFGREVGWVITHHRYDGGVKKAYIDPLGKLIISLGRDGNLVCTNLVANEVYEDLRDDLVNTMKSTKYALMFKRPTLGFSPEGRFSNKTWVEVDRIMKLEKEEEQCRAEKGEIVKELNDIKKTLTELVTSNLEGPENEKIDLVEFYLDSSAYHQKKIANREKCKRTEVYLKALMEAQDRVSQHIIKTYLEPMGVPGRIIRGIFQNSMATNYTLLPPNQAELMRLAWVEEQRKLEQFLSMNDTFEPWVYISNEDLRTQLKQQVVITNKDYSTMAATSFLEEYILSSLSIDSQIAVVGTVSQLYIERSTGHYKQRQLVSFHQCDLQQAIAEQEVIKLKQRFNLEFDKLVELKYRETDNIREKHQRLRHIISEYNYFSENKIFLDIIDPEWSQEEEPWLITKVLDNELTITPYVSPSEQAILDAKAAEDERIRLALLADDFRERALMTMMNGVLEIRWEDELKKDVPMPKCMIEKDPAEFNEEDLRAVKDYEEKVAFLNSERERYKNMLDVDFTRQSLLLRDAIRKFNQKVRDTVEYKMYIDSGMNQENLRINRARNLQNERIKIYVKEDNMNRSLKVNRDMIEQLQTVLVSMNAALNECRSNLETLVAKEKLLDKAFKRDFQEASPVVQEQALKLYKKRPRANYRQINTFAVMYELSKCIVSQERSLILNNDAYDYLKSLDQLDQFVGLPPTIDENTYGLICKHRRLRLEYEIKLRAIQMQISDGESTIATFHRRIAVKKEKNAQLDIDRQKSRADYLHLMHCLQIQVVLPRGLVEIPLTGDVHDFDDAMLVPKREIELINRTIKQAGEQKLRTIMQNMSFRRNIMATEWEHKRLRMEINDLTEQIADIEGIKFTREMQTYLKSKSLGRKTDHDSFEQEIDIITMTYHNSLEERKEKYRKIVHQINTYKEHNATLDKAIQEINIDVCQLSLQKDLEIECKQNEVLRLRMDDLFKRNSLVHTIQQNHNEMLVLQTELELLRLRTYPTFKYKLINPDE
ncbi:unnamed protein product [Phaedon cochleariae]|uniref:Cilia- and flagella-associated protein 43 n=1 Tax=Phaedon cochleariae TaxID=80249 RepID=A0A9P0DU29_PHACE|nr:unnamed protein product [Phaedon cochleariae]